MNKNYQVRLVALLGLAGNILLLIAKLTIGFASRSQAMIADGLNSAGDVFASVMTFIGNHISSRPSDEDHPYGHGKAEHVFSLIISLSLMLVAFTIFRSALDAFLEGKTFIFSIWLVLVALMTLLIKFGLWFHANYVSKTFKSLLARANAMDHRNDLFLTTLTLISIVTGYYQLFVVDAVVGMLLAFWIAYSGIQIFYEAYQVLMDKNISEDWLAAYADTVGVIEGVDHIDAITAKPLGSRFLLLVKVSVDANMTVYAAHHISDRIKATLMQYEDVEEVIIHMNPAQFHPERSKR